MTDHVVNRRQLAALATGAAAAGLTIAGTQGAVAYQGNMERAMSALYDALASLREATPDKGGHRVNAMNLIQQAIVQVQAGIEYADETGAGGPP
jgi:hypothetical protein